MFIVSNLNLNELTELETAISAERARRAGKPLTLWDRDGVSERPPSTGFVLCVRWAVEDQSYDDWYPTHESALAALDALARSHGRVRVEGRVGVDLTVSGCQPSSAWIEPVEEYKAY